MKTSRKKYKSPITIHWSFQTGEGGDFESLVKQLLPAKPISEEVGRKEIEVNKPGMELHDPEIKPAYIEGALMAPGVFEKRPVWKPNESFQNRPKKFIEFRVRILKKIW